MAEWVASVADAEEPCCEGLFLPGLGAQIDASVDPGNGITLRFQPRTAATSVSGPSLVSSKENNPGIAQSRDARLALLMNEWATERVLVIQEGATDHRVASPKTWRMDIRSALKEAKSTPDGAPLPFLARRIELYVDSPVKLDELAIQLFLVFYKWGWAENVSDEDRRYIIQYMCSLFELRNKMRAAAEQAVSYLFTNFAMPQNSGDFRLYIRRVVHDIHRKDEEHVYDGSGMERKGRDDLGSKSHEAPIDEFHVGPSARKSRKADVGIKEFVSPHEVALDCGMHYQRVYDAIRCRKLKAERWHGKLRIHRSEADRYKATITPKQLLQRMVSKLRESGNKKAAEALRKRIYRLRKPGASDGDILRTLSATRSR